MELSESTAGTIAPSPVVRQLDFTFTGNSKANPSDNSILPENRPACVESNFRSLAPASAQTKLPPRKMVMPPKSPQKELPQLDFTPKSLPSQDHPSQPLIMKDSPESHKRINADRNGVTPKKQRQCNCKNSRCLKLYCECFAAATYCDGCNCVNCHNNVVYDEFRRESMVAILERRPDAFKPKVASSPHGPSDRLVEHNKGCHCKKSTCLKKYCECYQANILCSEKCRCVDCKNYEGSEERKVHFLHHHQPPSIVSIQQAVNVSINGAIGSPVSKIKAQNFGFDNKQVARNHLPRQVHQESAASVHVLRSNPSVSVRPKYSYRSPLTGILRDEHIKNLCNALVNASVQSAMTLPFSVEEKSTTDEEDDPKNRYTSRENPTASGEESSDGFVSLSRKRPLSPGTLALICDEEDATFLEGKTTATAQAKSSGSEDGRRQRFSRSEIEQERRVLSEFRSFLNALITRGSESIQESNREAESEV